MTAPNLDLFYSSCTWGDPVGRPEGEKIVIVGESIDEYCDCLSFSSSSDRVFAVKFVGRNNFSCSDALLQIVLCRHLERKQQIHLMVTGISLRFIDNQSILCHAGFGWQLRDAVRKHLAVGHFLLPQMEIKSQ